MCQIYYKEDYNYQLQADYKIKVPIIGYYIKTDFIKLEPDGFLTIFKGYAWDGATRAIDTDDFMRGSLVHDVLYQLIREFHISITLKSVVDDILYRLCVEDGMSTFRAWYVKKAVNWFGANYLNKSVIRCSPRR